MTPTEANTLAQFISSKDDEIIELRAEIERLKAEILYWKGFVPHQVVRDFPFRRALEPKGEIAHRALESKP